VELSERFAALLRRPEAEVPLDEVALVIAAHARPELDIGAQLTRLDELAATCFAPTLDALVRHLFVDLGFRGNEGDYYDPRNSYLDEVVERRLGIPITLSVLTIEVGRRIGVPVAGVSLPGHFLLRDRVDADVFIDPFSGGAYLDQAGCERAFRALQGPDAPFDDTYLAPVGPHLIVARMLANLQAIFTNRGDDESLRWVLHLRSLTPGTQAARARARLN
jgi:regulator of sirC expression with transglutaminase-like and TPR domain